MDKYYYFASVLPLLAFAQETYVNRESFLEEAKKWLSAGDFTILSRVDINDFYCNKNDIPIEQEYKNFEKTLREELAFKRKPPDASAQYRPLGILKSAVLEGSPLEIEKKLLFLRWKFIENQEEGHYFDLEFFILYFLKLQILERLFTFNKEKGIAVFDRLVSI